MTTKKKPALTKFFHFFAVFLVLSGCTTQHDHSALNVFATAKTVELFAGAGGVYVAQDGKVTTATYDTKDDKIVSGLVPMAGGALSEEEITALHEALVQPEPNGTGMGAGVSFCCFPRHVFVFRDAANRYLGALKVCFACSCAFVNYPKPLGNNDTAEQRYFGERVEWDEAFVMRIVHQHQLPISFNH